MTASTNTESLVCNLKINYKNTNPECFTPASWQIISLKNGTLGII